MQEKELGVYLKKDGFCGPRESETFWARTIFCFEISSRFSNHVINNPDVKDIRNTFSNTGDKLNSSFKDSLNKKYDAQAIFSKIVDAICDMFSKLFNININNLINIIQNFCTKILNIAQKSVNNVIGSTTNDLTSDLIDAIIKFINDIQSYKKKNRIVINFTDGSIRF